MNKFVKAAFVLLFIVVFALACRTFWTLAHTFTPDFSVYYQAAKNIVSASSVYTEKQSFTFFAYPLVSGLFFIPFTLLPYHIAQTLFLCINFLVLLNISLIVPVLVLKKRSLFLSAVVFSFSYLSFPTKFTLGMGQINLVSYFLLLSSLFFYLHKTKHKLSCMILTAFLFAIACILKPILGFMLLFFILQKQWKIILYIFAFVAGVFALGAFIDHRALQDYIYYIRIVLPEVSRPVGKEIYYNQGLMSFVFRLTTNTQLRIAISYLGMGVIFLLGMSGIIKPGSRVKSGMTNEISLYQFSLLFSLLPLLDTLSWQHHFVVLILPFFYVAVVFVKKKKWKRFALLCVAYILVSWNFVYPEMFVHFPLVLLLSNTFYGAFLLFLILLTNAKLLQ